MKTTLITGCSSGFGMLTAINLASSGYSVFATMRNLDKKDKLLKKVNDSGGKIELIELDVTKNDTIIEAVEMIKSKTGRLDYLINNAGYGLGGFFEDISQDEFRQQMETNFFGVINVTREALPLMRTTARSNSNVKIINISSVQGRAPMPGLVAYATSKWAVEGFSESLYHELLPFGIKVILVEPGSYQTEIFTSNAKIAERSSEKSSPYNTLSNSFKQKIEQMTKGGTIGMGDNPKVVAQLIQQILESNSPKLRYVVGKDAKLRILLRSILPTKFYARILHKALFNKSISKIN
tara:strand:+ start:16191 stop:17072 length:882 start_codon:yes stop_codon:yes gene_type:complete